MYSFVLLTRCTEFEYSRGCLACINNDTFYKMTSWGQGLNQVKIWKFLYLFLWKIYCICFSFLDSTKRCHIDCSILSSAPPLSHMNRVYKILTIEVLLLSDSNGFNLQSSCWNSNPSLIIKIGCEGEFIHSNVLFWRFQHFIN